MTLFAIVQHEPSVPPGLIAEVLDERNVSYDVIEAWRNVAWPATSELDGLIVMGGTMNVDDTDHYPFLADSRSLMGAALTGGLPVLGVCLGSQMMSRVLGGEVSRCQVRNAHFSPVTPPANGSDDPLVREFATIPVLQFHEDTFSLPEGATLLAMSPESRGATLQAFRYGSSAYAIQFHFEVGLEIVADWCTGIGPDAMEHSWGVSPEDLLAEAALAIPIQAAAGRRLVESFLDIASHR